MSTPYRNTSDQDTCFILPKPLQSPRKGNQEEEVSDYDEKDIFQFQDTDANSNLFDNGIRKEKQNIIYTYSRRMSMRGALQASKRLFEKIKTEEQEQDDPEIKEECIETEVFQETFEAHQIPLGESFADDLSDFESDRKNCPYCPAVFESGVGLSNHVRGHLHRVGLSYNARHVVPPEQVASQDRRPRIRRKISTVKSIHSCPLCGDSFDNRTGQSNHIRGHLKKLGKSFSTKNKSPLILLRELMRDKKEFQRALQIIGKRRNHFHYGASPKLPSADRFTSPPTGIPKSHSITSVCTDAKPLMPTFSLAEIESDKRQLETKLDVKDSLSAIDCKAVRTRSRPGSKKKTLPLPQTPEEMYRLTCRFCDLVFQGPLSVQEDWIKHLQRHIMNTSVPHTGLGMVEVTSLPTDPPTLKTDQDSSLTVTHAAS
uniref:Zinc finger protein 644a n=1 Tax=Amphiprion percula TaxID=161767 RepID=A0A3P8T6L7_AMPPE